MTWKTKYATYPGARFAARWYGNGNHALLVEDDEGTVCMCSVNPPGTVLGSGRIAVKDWSENEGMVELLKEHGIIEGDPEESIPSGFVHIKVFRLTDTGKFLWERKK